MHRGFAFYARDPDTLHAPIIYPFILAEYNLETPH
jgi:hypothetical protein